MKVLMLNGSSHPKGCTFTALSEVGRTLEAEGVDYEIVNVGPKPLRDCIACGRCRETGRCIFDDDGVNAFIDKALEADGFVFGTPVYYAHPSGWILSFLDRVFYATGSGYRVPGAFTHKPAAVVASARRAGTTASLDVMGKYLGIASMPQVTGTYWNMVHGNTADEVLQDEEGLQTMRNVGRNMAWMIKAFAAAHEAGIEPPMPEHDLWTNFIR